MTLAVEMRSITKKFPRVLANDKVDLKIKQGEIHAILGENGAGKSTLMNILYGLYKPDEGKILINGRLVEFKNPREAVEAGIGMVHQHFMLIPTLTVTQNIILGSEITKAGFLDEKKANQIIRDLSKKYGLKVDPEAYVRDISVGVQQRVEILKILYRRAKIIILDEPTAVLTPQEVEELYVILDNLRNSGHTIIFITHKLKEILDISDRVTVLRNGRHIATLNTKDTGKEQLASLMVGRQVNLSCEKAPPRIGEVVLEVSKLCANNDRGIPVLKNISLNVRKGEIVGIAGVDGNGQTELIECISGLRKATAGKIKLNGKDITKSCTKDIINMGMGHIPEDRHKHGLILDFSLAENLLIGNLDNNKYICGKLVNYKKAHQRVSELIQKYSIKAPDSSVKACTLSGGNQQKLIVAREIDRNPDFLIAAQPTRGLDIGAIEFIHKKLIEQRNMGKGILLVSMELDEILQLSDRILVIYNGQIVGEMKGTEATAESLGLFMMGVKK